MISEYVEDLRKRLNVAVHAENRSEIGRLSSLLGAAMTDANMTGETMPWDRHCPLCGSDIVTVDTAEPGGERG